MDRTLALPIPVSSDRRIPVWSPLFNAGSCHKQYQPGCDTQSCSPIGNDTMMTTISELPFGNAGVAKMTVPIGL